VYDDKLAELQVISHFEIPVLQKVVDVFPRNGCGNPLLLLLQILYFGESHVDLLQFLEGNLRLGTKLSATLLVLDLLCEFFDLQCHLACGYFEVSEFLCFSDVVDSV